MKVERNFSPANRKLTTNQIFIQSLINDDIINHWLLNDNDRDVYCSSSSILSQTGAGFDNNQSLERLVDPNTTPVNGGGKLNFKQQTNNLPTVKSATILPSTSPTTPSHDQVKLLATPLRQPMFKGVNLTKTIGEQNTAATSAKTSANDTHHRQPPARLSTTASLTDCMQRPDTISELSPLIINKSLAGKSTTLTPFNVKNSFFIDSSHQPQSRNLPQDEEERRVKQVEQLYGDSEKVQAAAIIIQRTFRTYQICKRFRTITEQLRHTSNQSDKKRPEKNSLNSISDLPYASGTTRAAAWESLSQAANRLAAAAAAAKLQQQQQQVANNLPAVAPIATNKLVNQQQMSLIGQLQSKQSARQDQVVAAALNYQQLESIRKRQYRVGLNIFNKNPEKGISFLVAHSFIDSTSPYTKTSAGYYHSNQLHFIDSKQHLVQQLALPANVSQSCQLCLEEDNLKRNVAHFLLHRKGLAKEKIGQYLGNLQSQFNQDVLKYYLQELDFNGLQIDLALRKFLSTFRLPGEAQKIEKIVDCFAQRYVQCQQQQSSLNASSNNIVQLHQQPQQTKFTANNYKNNLILLTKDEIFILTFAIIMLNTDLHSPSLKPTSRMSSLQFVNNLRGVFKSQNINECDLIEIYERVKANQITTLPDHVSHVMKVQQGLTLTNFQKKELPNLCVPHRRLVCFCRLFEVYDVNKKERVGQHQREIFLFNDLLLVTKLARRVRANSTQLYTYRQSISLQGLYVQLFQSTHYNFGIRLCQRSNDETLIMFNARNELDQSRFVDDLGESIAEMDEMESIKAHNLVDVLHFKYQDRLRRHTLMHGNGASEINIQSVISEENNHPKNKMLNIINNCDNRIQSNKDGKQQPMGQDEIKEQRQSAQQPQSDSKTNSNVKSTTQTISTARRVQAKFSSMLNLSSAATDSKNDTGNNPQTNKGLRQNQSFAVQQPQQASIVEQVAEGSPRGSQQRRGSTSSVHSLDSGLFLSRDVSPNQTVNC